jgi:drug/metabolite transporter (DMT)-like permease
VSRYQDAGLFTLLAVVWGAGFTAIEVGLVHLPPILFAAFRFDLGAIITLSALAALGGLEVPQQRTDWLAILTAAVLLVFANGFLLFVGQRFTTGSIASVVYSLNPVMTAAFAALLIAGAGLEGRDYIGLALGLVGVTLVARPDPTGSSAAIGASALGALLIFGAVLAVSSGSVLMRRFDPPMGSLSVTGWAMAGGSLLFHIVSPLIGEPMTVPVRPETFAAIAYLGLGGSSLGYGAYFVLLKRRGPFTVNLVNYAIPLVATLTGWALLGETLAPLAIVGFGFIVVGFLVLNRRVVAQEIQSLRELSH